MYFSLEVNEQLANVMRAGAEFKIEVEKIIECVYVDENGTLFAHSDAKRSEYRSFKKANLLSII